ncbi:ferric reductase-like transmembrane domain-containing protein [Aphanothece sacrum]|uniref:Sulfite oxidase n=1 Tax=Aphanothece sacrum FPU1 TaxID=1920663 RepID=A0A401IC93_APHSA|nr:ferric reductase-like transmembrane domain-containing protein [Aphanothece sacrum]GBF78913.1 sulfite oxidase [Aphanothece sacrum FPU1]GBF86740.1 sulfite oxidase [Aphanothece sacrum FPU3]
MTFNTGLLGNFLGFVAIFFYIVTLLPTNLRIVFPQTKKTGIPKFLLQQRRLIGILAFLVALGHGYLLVMKRDFDFFDFKTSWIYIQGVVTLTIFTLLAITSNDWSIKRLKKNWKRLHNLTYIAMFLLTWHIWGKMSGHWTYLTPISLVGMGLITILYLLRRYIEKRNELQKKKQKEVPALLPEKVEV